MGTHWAFRPHHLLCWQTFQGEGYSPGFVANFERLIEQAGLAQRLRVTMAPDVICQACPHQTHEGCHFQEKVLGLDQRVAEALDLVDGQTLTFEQGLAKTRGQLPALIERCCSGCDWQPFCREIVMGDG